METTQNSSTQEPQEQITSTSTQESPKASSKKGAKKVKPGAWKKDPKLIAKLKKDIPLGSLVEYTGSRVEDHQGKRGLVVGYRDANGLYVDFKDGRGSISVPKTKVLRKGPAKKEATTGSEVPSN